VDLATGDRSLVSGTNRGTGPRLQIPRDVAVDEAGSWWTVGGSGGGQVELLRVDPATGDRTLVSSQARGSGPHFEAPQAVLVEEDGTVIVVNGGARDSYVTYPFATVMRVDPATGDRTVLSRF
jgi:hypothetical protein